MTELEIESAYGPIQSTLRVSRGQLATALAAGGGFFVVGAAIAAASTLFARAGERSRTQLGLVFVGGFLALVVPVLLIGAVFRGRNDVLELRAFGVVRRSSALGLKHVRYVDIARIEHHLRGTSTTRIDVFGRDGAFLGVHGFDREPGALIDDLSARAHGAGAEVIHETRTS